MHAINEIIAHQQKLINNLAPTLKMIQRMNQTTKEMQRQLDNQEKIRKLMEVPLVMTEAIKYMQLSNPFYKQFEQYRKQANYFMNIISPTLLSFVNRANHMYPKADTTNYINLAYVNSFEAVKEFATEDVEDEVSRIKEIFETNEDFRNEVTNGIELKSTCEVSHLTLIISQIIEKYAGKISVKAVGVFISFIVLIYVALIPMIENKLPNEALRDNAIDTVYPQSSEDNLIERKGNLNYNINSLKDSLDSRTNRTEKD